MAQAVVNNLINNTVLTEKAASPKELGDFQKVLDKQQVSDDKTETALSVVSGTLGALKENSTEKFREFTNILKEVTQEAAEELSLDLTLEKDIEEVIETLETNQDEETEDAATTEKDEDSTLNNDITKEITQDTTAIIQNIIPQTKVNNVNNNDDEVSIPDDNTAEELKVTLNGEDLDSALENFGVNTSEEELPVIKSSETEENKEAKTLDELVDEEMLNELNIEEVETSNENASSDLMKNQTPEEQGVKAMLQADADFAEIKPEAKPNVSAPGAKPAASTDVTPSKIIEQITKQMEGMHNGSKVNIVLNPESLGKVSVQLINTKEGLSAQFTVASQDARNLIMKGIDGLKDTLMSHGVSVDSVSVKLNETQDTEYSADWTEQEGSRGGNKEQGTNKGHKEKENFEQMMSFVQDEEN